jgi:hypothetical protein
MLNWKGDKICIDRNTKRTFMNQRDGCHSLGVLDVVGGGQEKAIVKANFIL